MPGNDSVLAGLASASAPLRLFQQNPPKAALCGAVPHDLGALRMLSNRRALHHPRSFAASADSAVIVDPGQIPTEDRCAPFKRRYRPSAIKIDPLKSTRRNRVVSGIVLPPLRIVSRWPCSIWSTASSSFRAPPIGRLSRRYWRATPRNGRAAPWSGCWRSPMIALARPNSPRPSTPNSMPADCPISISSADASRPIPPRCSR